MAGRIHLTRNADVGDLMPPSSKLLPVSADCNPPHGRCRDYDGESQTYAENLSLHTSTEYIFGQTQRSSSRFRKAVFTVEV